jgi:PAS domain S-box-containing protein
MSDKQQGVLVKTTEKLQYEVENAIQVNDQKLAQFLEAVSIGVFVVDANGRPFYANRKAQQILGKDIIANFGARKLAENCQIYLAGTTQLYPKGQQPVFQALNGKTSNVDDMEIHQSDNIIPIEVWGTPIFDEYGNVAYAIAAFQDITERKQMLDALQISEEKYRSLMDNLNVGVFRTAVDGKILSVNHALVKLFGFDFAEELMQLPVVIRYVDPTQGEKLLAKLREYGEVKDFETELLCKDDSSVCASISCILKLDAKGNPLFLDGVIEDISVRKEIEIQLANERASLAKKVEQRTAELSQANAKLARAARLKDEFLANMSHELRTPLNAILSMSELLTDGIYGETNAGQLKAIGHIESGGRHLLSLINDILDLSKIEAGKMDLNPENIIIDGVCRACVQMVKQIAMKKQVKVLFAPDDEVETIFADQRAVKQILVNLLNNAVKFTPHNGKVTLELQGDRINRVANINVIDTGIGIEEHELDNLFKPFMQIDSSLNRQHEGTGLGLALVYKLVELHGGSVHVESQVGSGSTFTISLPWQRDSKAIFIRDDEYVTAVKNDIKVHNKGAVVLVAEDNETNIVTVRDGLTAYGYKVIITRNGAEAFERAQEIKPAIILMDIQMPGMDGYEAIKAIRADADEQLAKTPIIALTALAMPGDKKRCLDAGANVYLSKPVNNKRLVAEIEGLLNG